MKWHGKQCHFMHSSGTCSIEFTFCIWTVWLADKPTENNFVPFVCMRGVRACARLFCFVFVLCVKLLLLNWLQQCECDYLFDLVRHKVQSATKGGVIVKIHRTTTNIHIQTTNNMNWLGTGLWHAIYLICCFIQNQIYLLSIFSCG